MKSASTRIALLAVLMQGISSVTYLYGQAVGGPSTAVGPSTASSVVAPSAGFDGSQGTDAQEYRTVHIKYAGASLLAKQLKELLPRYTVIIGDDRTNQIVIRGPME